MRFEETAVAGVLIIRPKRHQDHRGYFSEILRDDLYASAGITDRFVQENISHSTAAGTLRGLHFQLAPRAQAKLIRVTNGAIRDVAVDLRKDSPTFGHHVAADLDAEAGALMYVPAGCAHGFCTLVADTEVSYKVSDYWSADHERGLLWCDPALGIEWPFAKEQVAITPRDRDYPVFADLPKVCFTYPS
ncbi:MAG TPA: dTDP-4-dehydrorhamnose 3,5-epimerase [Polyangiaceae bacterium]|jgi:dTDP-4-dehydrorhamnose 3,5-epimerase|nr:dTDP-4-dehydrorhamnose 3,5-epimerase [Polyangiaceae bacterium]